MFSDKVSVSYTSAVAFIFCTKVPVMQLCGISLVTYNNKSDKRKLTPPFLFVENPTDVEHFCINCLYGSKSLLGPSCTQFVCMSEPCKSGGYYLDVPSISWSSTILCWSNTYMQ